MAEIIVMRTSGHAKIILEMLQQRAHEIQPNKDICHVFVEHFTNCRERGYTIYQNIGHQVSFAENRNSDEIVVYPFFWDSKTAEEDYKTKTKRFGYQDWVAATDFIIGYLNEEGD